MQRRTRRRIDAALLVVGAAVVAGVAAAGAVLGDEERLAALWVGAEVGEDGSARIVEVVDYDFGSQTRHGIFRDVPGLAPGARIVVSSPTAPDDLLATGNSLETRIRIGDPNRTIGGRHRYTIEYPLPGVAPNGVLGWNAVGSSWPVPIGEAQIHVVAPFRLAERRCSRGGFGASDSCEVREAGPGHLTASVEGLDAGQGVTVSATAAGPVARPSLPSPPAGPTGEDGAGVLPILTVGALAALAATTTTSFLVRRAGRERVGAGTAADAAWSGAAGGDHVLVDHERMAELATIEFAPPPELSPPQGGVVLSEHVRDEHKVAWLIKAAIDGYVEIEEDEGKLTLVRGKRRDGETAYELDLAFGGRDWLWLGSYDRRFATAWAAVGNRLSSWQRGSGLWDPAGDRRRSVAKVSGTVLTVLGLVSTGLAGALASRRGASWSSAVVAAALVAGTGWAALLRAWELRVRTPLGSGLWLRVESFRRFLSESEASHADDAAGRGVLREYTAWAVAVGEMNRWSRAVAASSVGGTDPDAVRYAALAPSLSSATSSSSTPPSSSGGGSGGGSVGSGAGGGGGGSW